MAAYSQSRVRKAKFDHDVISLKARYEVWPAGWIRISAPASFIDARLDVVFQRILCGSEVFERNMNETELSEHSSKQASEP